MDLCRPPYDSIWMETHAKPDHWFDAAQERDGFLIDGEMVHGVTSVSFARGVRMVYPAWERYHLQTDWPRAEQTAFFAHYNISDWKRWVLGKLCDLPAWQALTDDECRLLLDRVRIDLFGTSDEADERLRYTIQYIVLAGSMLPPLGCLLLLNHPKVVRQVPVPHYRRFMGGKSRQVREHMEITVDLSSQEIVRYFTDQRQNSEAARRHRHDVRGHFAHDYVAREAACVHAWVRDDAAAGTVLTAWGAVGGRLNMSAVTRCSEG